MKVSMIPETGLSLMMLKQCSA